MKPIRNDGNLGGTLDYNATHSGSQLTGESTREWFFDGEFIFPYFEATVSGDNLKGFGQYYVNSDPDHKCGDGHCGYDFDVTWDRETL